ncbi:RNA polymerase sigma-70 factor [Carboxylicivirga sediminis]|uniref:RNA polymerase sigma-70 factor n=1 Tax=Carboxylicivirga sediminis TaxID=2006564 RepID=A0A941IV57_9BACT|nr:RNA polymerase sigma-70 factor [Carboxylicivirga sediminis]MBR8533953.1 RNA polymerase sigma-70 factor [Carboxylicivirga sediminis]
MSKHQSDILYNKYQIKHHFEEWFPGLVIFARQFIQSSTEAEDIVQNAFIKLFENFEEEKNLLAAKGFLYKTIRNECINILKHEAVKRKYSQQTLLEVSSETYFLNKIIEEETYSTLTNAINQLPEQCQKILILSLNGLKNNEIAEDLSISINTVKSQKKRAYKRLKEQLKNVYQIVSFASGI